MYNFLKKAFHLSSEKNEDTKIDDNYLKSIIFQAERNNASEKTLKTIREIISAIAKKDKKLLREICSSSGIPEEAPLLRSILWKINLKFLDLNVESWPDIIAKKRSEYNNMKEAFIIKMEIDRKIHEDSSGNNTNNNIKRKNGDSINETGEESKDSSSKSKSNSRNNLNVNNNSKSKLSSNFNTKDNLAGLNSNNNNGMSNINYNNNNNKYAFNENFKNLNEEENENKNNLDKNANLNSSSYNQSSNFTTNAFGRNPTFGVISSNNTNNDGSQKNPNVNEKEKDFGKVNTEKNNEFDCFNNKNAVHKTGLEDFISKNQNDFSRNFLNLEFDERKMKKNKKNIISNHSEIYKEFSRLEDNLLSNQAQNTKTYEISQCNNSSLGNESYAATNITFDNQSKNFNNQNNKNANLKQENEFDYPKKLNGQPVTNTFNSDLSKLPLPNHPTNQNVETNFINKFERKTIVEENYNFNNKQQVDNEFNINSNYRNNYALTPQIKLNNNERDSSNDNRNKNKIDFNFSVIDFLNKNLPNNQINKTIENTNVNSNINKFIPQHENKDKFNSMKFLTINDSRAQNKNYYNNDTYNNNNPSINAGIDVQDSQKIFKIQPINLNTKAIKDNSNPYSTNNTADNTYNKTKTKLIPNANNNYMNNSIHNNINSIKNHPDLKNNKEEKKVPAKNQKPNLTKKQKGPSAKTKQDPLLETHRKNAKLANYEDKALIEEIYKDMKRMHSEFQFLLKPSKPKSEDVFSNFHLEKILTQKNKNTFENEDPFEDEFQPETHLDVIARLLYIFAKLNKNIRYVQGMNELASLIYFVIMQEEELEKINFLMQKNYGNFHSTNNNYYDKNNLNNKNEKFLNLNLPSNKGSYSNKKELFNNNNNNYHNNFKINKDKEKFGFKNHSGSKVNEKGKSLDASNSFNATTKLCDLARLEEAEEEKNFFDLNADRKIANFQVESPVKDKLHQEENYANFYLQKRNQQQNTLLGVDKNNNNINNNNLINYKDNPTLNDLNNLHYVESVNNHEELFGLNSNRLVKDVNHQNNKNYLIKKTHHNNNNVIIKVDADNRINNKNDHFVFNNHRENKHQDEFVCLDKLNHKNNLFLTPDNTKDKTVSKLNLNQINKHNNNNNRINQLNPNENNYPINNNFNNFNSQDQNFPSSNADRKLQTPLTAEKITPSNAKVEFNPKASNVISPETDFEADTFWCFCYLMDQLKYIYLRSEDHKERGIMRKLENLKNLLKIIDKNLFSHLESVSVDITLFGFKWIVLLFSQNFCIKDALKIWDLILFVEPPTDIFYKVYYIALAVFESKRNKIIGSDFPGVVLQLQNLYDINVESLIAVYRKIMKDSGKKIKKALGY